MDGKIWTFDKYNVITPYGDKIGKNILEAFTYWNYLQQGIGFGNSGPPTQPKHFPPDFMRDIYLRVEYLIDLKLDEMRRHGIMVQEEFSLSPANAAGEGENLDD